jgi:hypothetical protein
MIISSSPDMRRLPFGIRVGVNVPSRSRGIARSTSPVWVATFFGVVPFLEFDTADAAGSPFS